MADAADTLAYPLLLLLPDGQLLYANHTGQTLLDSGYALTLAPDGRVTPVLAARRSLFLSTLRLAAEGHRQPLVWPETPDVVHGWACPLAETVSGGPTQPLMLVLSPPPGTRLDVSGFASNHKLTRAEARVLEHVAAGLDTRAVAQALGVGVATVRSHLMSIRRKTGHPDVPSLLTVLGGLPPLLPEIFSPLLPSM